MLGVTMNGKTYTSISEVQADVDNGDLPSNAVETFVQSGGQVSNSDKPLNQADIDAQKRKDALAAAQEKLKSSGETGLRGASTTAPVAKPIEADDAESRDTGISISPNVEDKPGAQEPLDDFGISFSGAPAATKPSIADTAKDNARAQILELNARGVITPEEAKARLKAIGQEPDPDFVSKLTRPSLAEDITGARLKPLSEFTPTGMQPGFEVKTAGDVPGLAKKSLEVSAGAVADTLVPVRPIVAQVKNWDSLSPAQQALALAGDAAIITTIVAGAAAPKFGATQAGHAASATTADEAVSLINRSITEGRVVDAIKVGDQTFPVLSEPKGTTTVSIKAVPDPALLDVVSQTLDRIASNPDQAIIEIDAHPASIRAAAKIDNALASRGINDVTARINVTDPLTAEEIAAIRTAIQENGVRRINIQPDEIAVDKASFTDQLLRKHGEEALGPRTDIETVLTDTIEARNKATAESAASLATELDRAGVVVTYEKPALAVEPKIKTTRIPNPDVSEVTRAEIQAGIIPDDPSNPAFIEVARGAKDRTVYIGPEDTSKPQGGGGGYRGSDNEGGGGVAVKAIDAAAEGKAVPAPGSKVVLVALPGGLPAPGNQPTNQTPAATPGIAPDVSPVIGVPVAPAEETKRAPVAIPNLTPPAEPALSPIAAPSTGGVNQPSKAPQPEVAPPAAEPVEPPSAQPREAPRQPKEAPTPKETPGGPAPEPATPAKPVSVPAPTPNPGKATPEQPSPVTPPSPKVSPTPVEIPGGAPTPDPVPSRQPEPSPEPQPEPEPTRTPTQVKVKQERPPEEPSTPGRLPRFTLPNGEELAAGTYPRLVGWQQGKFFVEFDLDTGRRTQNYRTHTKGMTPRNSFVVLTTDNTPPPDREFDLGFEKVFVSRNGLRFEQIARKAQRPAAVSAKVPRSTVRK